MIDVARLLIDIDLLRARCAVYEAEKVLSERERRWHTSVAHGHMPALGPFSDYVAKAEAEYDSAVRLLEDLEKNR